MPGISDPESIIVSEPSFQDTDRGAIVDSSVSVINALLEQLLTFDELAPDAVRSYYVDYLCAQVGNGGFSQFVYNSRWDPKVVTAIREGIAAMGATSEAAWLERAERFVAEAGRGWVDQFLATDYFGDNPIRDSFDEAVRGAALSELRDRNAAWLRAHPRLVVASIDDMVAEVRRRGAALPDREARIARVREAEPRTFKLMRALAERAGQQYERPTAATRRTYQNEEVWAYHFLTDAGVYVMIDHGTRAAMFPASDGDTIDPASLVVAIDCEPER